MRLNFVIYHRFAVSVNQTNIMQNDSSKNDACKTYLEQTKLLVTLSSAFIIAPVFFIEKIPFFNWHMILMELFFVSSVLAGYVVFGTISGTQYKGEFNVYNTATFCFSWAQIILFISGLFLLIYNLNIISKSEEDKKDKEIVKSSKEYIKGEIVRLENIYFDNNKWSLRPESYSELNKLALRLQKKSSLKIEIQAHTDNIGKEVDNLLLSDKRAEVVMKYIINKGTSITQVTSKGFGETIPIISNATYEGRQINRRVEFKIIQE